MAENQEVEKVAGTWNGMPVRIKKVWSTHEFTADELTKLFNGETIEFEATSKKTGNMYKAKGKLEKQTFTDDNGNEHEFVGFKLIFDEKKSDDVERFEGSFKGKIVKIKRVWGEHRFTDSEVEALLQGETIKFEAISQKTGNAYTASGKLAEQTFEGRTFIGFKPDFK